VEVPDWRRGGRACDDAQMAVKVFIDGHVGTTGLRIHEALAARSDIELIAPAEADRKILDVRRDFLRQADLAILCLPDEAAREAVASVAAGDTRIIDASSAHRVSLDFVYGLPEISDLQRESIREGRLVANPGCYPTSVILGLAPLLEEGFLRKEAPITIHALSGYSGGGRQLIEKWEDPRGDLAGLPFEAPYAFDRQHKHIAEMVHFCGLEQAPYFLPAVGPFASGMRVEIPLHASFLQPGATGATIHALLKDRYASELFVKVMPFSEEFLGDEKTLDPGRWNGTNAVSLSVLPHPDGHILLVGLLDNLGKGAAGAAIQNLNLMLGFPEDTGLRA